MNDFHIGQIIKEHRIEKGLTQKELSDGVCSLSTLSRAESGEQLPGRFVIDSLLERLGVSPAFYHGIKNLDEIAIKKYMIEIKALNALHKNREVILLCNELEEKYNCDDNITAQFLLWMEAVSGRIENDNVVLYSPEEKLDMLNKAIKLTHPKYDDITFKGSLFTVNEVMIIISMANAYVHLENYEKSIDIYDKALNYVTSHFFEVLDEANIIPLIAYNYSLVLGKQQKYTQSLDIAEIGISSCIKYDKARIMGRLLINKSCGLKEQGYIEEAKDLAIQSYYLSVAMNKPHDAKRVLEHLKEEHNWEPC